MASGVSLYGVSRFVIKFVVVLLEFYLPSRCTWANFMGFTLIGEVAVVGPNNNGDGCSSEQM